MLLQRLVVLLLLTPIAAAAAQRDSTPAPTQAELDDEFRRAARAAAPLAQSFVGDTAGFLASIQPYGPLDLVILKGLTPRHSNLLRSFFLGVVGSAARIDPAPFANRWHCGHPCALARRDTLMRRLPQLDTLVRQFRAIDSATVVATWPHGGYRFGLVSFAAKRYYRSTPSPLLGLLPWRSEPADSSDRALWGTSVTRQAVETLVAGMRAAGVAAIVREGSQGVRVVLRGAIGDNEAGLLFLPANLSPPAFSGVELLDGRRYLGGELVAPGVYFYMTT
jgi:hypothetical protein